jgi:hypothetical protein
MLFQRRQEHQRNEKLEGLLKEINELLGPVESEAIENFERTKYPAVLIMGSPRSGTTLLLQWLSTLGHFSYPTNILSRFYNAPYIGAKIQLMLTRHDFNREIFDFNETVPFASNLGKTKGALAPNEFWYFWRRFFHFKEIQRLEDNELKNVDHRTFVAEIAALESVFGQPFAMKGMIVNWNIPFVDRILEKVLFIYIKRSPFLNIQSLLTARINYYGDERGWYSFKPPEYPDLADRNACEQVAGQIYYTNRAVEEGLDHVDQSRSLQITYEDLCRAPRAVFEKIADKLRAQGYEGHLTYRGAPSFHASDRIRLSPEKVKEVVAAYKKFSGEIINPHG